MNLANEDAAGHCTQYLSARVSLVAGVCGPRETTLDVARELQRQSMDSTSSLRKNEAMSTCVGVRIISLASSPSASSPRPAAVPRLRLGLLGDGAKGGDELPHGEGTSGTPPAVSGIKSASVPFVFSTPRTQEQWAREAEDESESEDELSQPEYAVRRPSPSIEAMRDASSVDGAPVQVEERVEVAVVSSTYSHDQMMEQHLQLEEMVADAIGFLRVDRIQIILGPMDSARSLKGGEKEEETCAVLVIGLESGVSMDASMRALDVAQELVRQAKDVRAPLRLSLSEVLDAAVLDARLLPRDEPARTAGYYADLQRTRLEFVCQSISTKRKASMTALAWSSWIQEHRRRAKKGLILHYLLSKQRTLLLAARLGSWQDSTRQQQHFKGVCKHIILRWLSRCLAMSFVAWRRSSLDSRRLKRCCWGKGLELGSVSKGSCTPAACTRMFAEGYLTGNTGWFSGVGMPQCKDGICTVRTGP